MKVVRKHDGKVGKLIWFSDKCSKTLQYQIQFEDEIRWHTKDDFVCESDIAKLKPGRVCYY